MHQQEPLLGDDLVETPFGYKGYVGDHWVMEETLPPASMEPNMDAVNRIKVQPDRLEVGDSFLVLGDCFGIITFFQRTSI